MPAPKKKLTMPSDTCGGCKFAVSEASQQYLLCMAMPPHPVPDQIEVDGVTWERGGAVEPNDPACYFFIPKGMV